MLPAQVGSIILSTPHTKESPQLHFSYEIRFITSFFTFIYRRFSIV